MRNYNLEQEDRIDRKYAYGFDYDVMHPYMIKSFTPFFVNGSLLELGSHEGAFTKLFIPYFDDITCVEASDIAIKKAISNSIKTGIILPLVFIFASNGLIKFCAIGSSEISEIKLERIGKKF